MLVGGHGEVNPNVNWLQSRGLWIAYGLGILAFHIFLLSIPFLTVPVAWTLTNLSHNALHLIFLHTLKGTPWPSQDQGDCRRLTHWEQIDGGLQFTSTRKFLSVTPVILFFLTNLYTKYDPVHFYINFMSLIVVLLPKLPQFHKLPSDLFNGIQDKVNIKHGNLELWERCCMHYWEGEWHYEQFNLAARYRGQLPLMSVLNAGSAKLLMCVLCG